MGRRDYPPGVILHAPHCVEGGNSPALPIEAAFGAYPSRQLHFCFGGMIPAQLEGLALQDVMPHVVIEHWEYGGHEYQQSDDWPNDAIRPLCRRCRGTHGDTLTAQPATGTVLP